MRNVWRNTLLAALAPCAIYFLVLLFGNPKAQSEVTRKSAIPPLPAARSEELISIYETWSTERLLTAVGRERHSYEPEAVALMEEELRRREAP